MKLAGIDIGSRSIELIVLEDGKVIHSVQAESGYDPIARVKELISNISFDKIMATGYGRGIVEVALDYPTVTEIKAYGAGATALHPGTRSVLDIGGQDTKVISINENGKVVKFEMNDKCAAGTGKFLEIMATTLGYKDRNLLRDGLAMTLAKTPEEEAIFLQCFDRFFSQARSIFPVTGKGQNPGKSIQHVEGIGVQIQSLMRCAGCTGQIA